MSWQLGLARLEAELGRSLQRAARKAGGAERLWRADSQKLGELLRLAAAAVAGLEAIREQFNPTVELTRLAAEEI